MDTTPNVGKRNSAPSYKRGRPMTSSLNGTALGASLLRVSLGTLFLSHGLLKYLVFTPAGAAGYFESVGIPGVLAYLVIAAEIGGGALLLLGAYVRLVALGLTPIAIGATLVHLPNGWVFSAEGGGWEFPALLVLLTLVQAMTGAGAFALRAPRLPGLPQALAA